MISPEEASDGPSLQSFGAPWGHQLSKLSHGPEPLIFSGADFAGGQYYSWADQSADGEAHFNASAFLAPNASVEQSRRAFYRLVTMYMVTYLNDSALKDAYDSLTDILRWQIDTDKVELVEPAVHHVGTFKPRLVKREPFSVDW